MWPKFNFNYALKRQTQSLITTLGNNKYSLNMTDRDSLLKIVKCGSIEHLITICQANKGNLNANNEIINFASDIKSSKDMFIALLASGAPPTRYSLH